MKKFTWILILSILLGIIPNYSSNNIVHGQKINSLKFKDIESLIIKKNPTIKINDNTKSNLIDSIEDIRDAKIDKRDLEDAIDGIDDAIDGLNSAIRQQDIMINRLKEMLPTEDKPPIENQKSKSDIPDNPEIDGEKPAPVPDQMYQTLLKNQFQTIGIQIGTLESVKGLYKSNISSLKQNRDSMKDQLKEFDKLPIREMELEKAIFQIDMGNQSIIWGAQNLYLAYNNLKIQRDELVQNLELLNTQIDIMTIQEQLGMITSLEILGIKNQRKQIKFGINTLENQMDNLIGELNLMLGEDFYRPLQLEDTPKVDKDFISKINYKDDKKTAIDSSYSIKLKDFEYNIQYDTMLWENKNRNYEQLITAKRNVENAEIELEQEEKNVELAFSKAYQGLKTKITEFENEENNLEYQQEKYDISKLKYELGTISKMEFEDAKSKYDSQKNKIKTVEQDLFKILLQYKALLKGVNFIQ